MVGERVSHARPPDAGFPLRHGGRGDVECCGDVGLGDHGGLAAGAGGPVPQLNADLRYGSQFGLLHTIMLRIVRQIENSRFTR
jgi:hypothetical protein